MVSGDGKELASQGSGPLPFLPGSQAADPRPQLAPLMQKVRAAAPKLLCTEGPKDPLQAWKRPLSETLELPHSTCLI